MTYIVLAVGAALVGLALYLTVFTVEQQTVAIIQRFGRFHQLARAGLNFKIPFVERIAARVSMRVQQLDTRVETKTQDNVFVHVIVSVQYLVLPQKVKEAYYKLTEPREQIKSYVFDVVRAEVPRLKLDEVFERKDDIANAVKTHLSDVMDDFGYGIVQALVTDVDPDPKVKESMNEINAAQRLRVAAEEKGEAEKILMIKEAQAEAESKRLQGRGIADQRKEIARGLQEALELIQEGVPGCTAQDALSLTVLTQYLDTMQAIGANSRSNTILVPHGPGAVADLETQIRDAMIVANQVPTGNREDDEVPSTH